MLVKNLAVEKYYLSGFNDPNSQITVKLVDLDRKLVILEGDSVIDRMDFQIKGIMLGLSMAGYASIIQYTKERDGVTKLERKLK